MESDGCLGQPGRARGVDQDASRLPRDPVPPLVRYTLGAASFEFKFGQDGLVLRDRDGFLARRARVERIDPADEAERRERLVQARGDVGDRSGEVGVKDDQTRFGDRDAVREAFVGQVVVDEGGNAARKSWPSLQLNPGCSDPGTCQRGGSRTRRLRDRRARGWGRRACFA